MLCVAMVRSGAGLVSSSASVDAVSVDAVSLSAVLVLVCWRNHHLKSQHAAVARLEAKHREVY